MNSMDREHQELDERSARILRAIILAHIKSSSPVGSRMIEKNYDVGLSSATIRNVMADLEEMGYLMQPHVSAGRIPTEHAYRVYVEGLREEMNTKGIMLKRRDNLPELLQETSHKLSRVSHYMGLVFSHAVSHALLRHIEFIKVRPGLVSTILVFQDGFVQNRMVETDMDFPQEKLDRIGAYLNERFRLKTIPEIRGQLIREMKEERDLYDQLLMMARELSEKVFTETEGGEIYVGGTTSFFDLPDFSNIDKLKTVFKAIEEKATILRLLEKCMDATDVRVFIGSENAVVGLSDCSVVVASYGRGRQVCGTLGIIGPIRMEYGKVIPLVRGTAEVLSHLLEDTA